LLERKQKHDALPKKGQSGAYNLRGCGALVTLDFQVNALEPCLTASRMIRTFSVAAPRCADCRISVAHIVSCGVQHHLSAGVGYRWEPELMLSVVETISSG